MDSGSLLVSDDPTDSASDPEHLEELSCDERLHGDLNFMVKKPPAGPLPLGVNRVEF
jgi:hypothetical protein